jgi:hypothetical protein
MRKKHKKRRKGTTSDHRAITEHETPQRQAIERVLWLVLEADTAARILAAARRGTRCENDADAVDQLAHQLNRRPRPETAGDEQ